MPTPSFVDLFEHENGLVWLSAEIAAQLVIAVTTIRTHTRTIYAKLEVGNRREAISRARALGLLPA